MVSYPIDVLLDILKITTSNEGELQRNESNETNNNNNNNIVDATGNKGNIELFRMDTTDHVPRDIVRVITPSIRDKHQLLKERRLRNCRLLLTHLNVSNPVREFIIDHYCNVVDSSNLLSIDPSSFLRLVLHQHQVFRNLKLDYSVLNNFESLWRIQSAPPFPPTLSIERTDGNTYRINEEMRIALAKHLMFVNSSVESISQKYQKV